MQVGVGIDYDQLTDTVYWSDIRYSVSLPDQLYQYAILEY